LVDGPLIPIGPYRKKLIELFAYTGSIASALFVFISPTVYFLAPILVIIGVTCLGCSNMLLNAFLPLLVSNYRDDKADDESSDFELEALNPESTTTRSQDPEKLTRDLERSAKLSSTCLGYSYIAAVSAELLAIGILVLFKNTSIAKNSPTLPMRMILLFVGVWWATFTIPTILYLRPRPGPPLPIQSQPQSRKQNSSFVFYTKFSLASFWNTLRHAFRLRQVVIFLIAW
jgi:UMF1 family MFS transporter